MTPASCPRAPAASVRPEHSLHYCLPLRRIVRANITERLAPEDWQVILPEHEKDILTGSSALKVPLTADHMSLRLCAALIVSSGPDGWPAVCCRQGCAAGCC